MNLCTCVNEERDDGEALHSETPSLLSYTLRYFSFAEVGSVCRVALREPTHLCTCVSEEGGDLLLQNHPQVEKRKGKKYLRGQHHAEEESLSSSRVLFGVSGWLLSCS
jgi:hypothetical protein